MDFEIGEIYTEAELSEVKVRLNSCEVFGSNPCFELLKDEDESRKQFILPDGSVVFIFGATSKGKSDTCNQDSVVVGNNFLAVADGVGSSDNAKLASEYAVKFLAERLPLLIDEIGESEFLYVDNIKAILTEKILELIEELNDEIVDLEGISKTTLDLAFVLPLQNYDKVLKNYLVTVHIGDGSNLRKTTNGYKNIALHQNLTNLGYLTGLQYINGGGQFRDMAIFESHELLAMQDKLLSTEDPVKDLAINLFDGARKIKYGPYGNITVHEGGAIISFLGNTTWLERKDDIGSLCLDPQVNIVELDDTNSEKFLFSTDGLIDQADPNINEMTLNLSIDSTRKGNNPAQKLVCSAKEGPKKDHISAGVVVVKPPFSNYLRKFEDLLEIDDLITRKQEMRNLIFDLFEVPEYSTMHLGTKNLENKEKLLEALLKCDLLKEFNTVLSSLVKVNICSAESVAVMLALLGEI